MGFWCFILIESSSNRPCFDILDLSRLASSCKHITWNIFSLLYYAWTSSLDTSITVYIFTHLWLKTLHLLHCFGNTYMITRYKYRGIYCHTLVTEEALHLLHCFGNTYMIITHICIAYYIYMECVIGPFITH
jgi:hypothetical protein